MSQKFSQLILGGTFDLLHKGHQKLIETAFQISQFVTIGLTDDSFNSQRQKNTYQNQTDRHKALTEFLKQKGYSNRFKILSINNIYGHADEIPELEAILATEETSANAKLINQKRLDNNLQPLAVIKIDHLLDSKGQIISSSRIRNGEIDAQGNYYYDLLFQIADQTLSDQIKNQFKKPFGKITNKVVLSKTTKIVTVGDITTKAFLSQKAVPNLAIVDLKTKRSLQFKNIYELGFHQSPDATVNNPPGMVSSDLINSVSQLIKSTTPSLILVNGEEDLAVIPALLLSPLRSKIYYGQPDQGVVEVIVTPEIKTLLINKLNLRI